MSDLLIISENELLLEDLKSQISLYAPELNVFRQDCVPDIVILDEKKEMVSSLRNKYPQTPIFVLLPKEEDRPKDFSVVKYISKPIVLSELINALCAAENLAATSGAGRLKFNQYELRALNKEILNLRNNEVTKLTEKEVSIIQYLYKNQKRIVTKTELLQEVWGYSPDVTTHTIETHIYRLRQKIEHDDLSAQIIVTKDGGYYLKK